MGRLLLAFIAGAWACGETSDAADAGLAPNDSGMPEMGTFDQGAGDQGGTDPGDMADAGVSVELDVELGEGLTTFRDVPPTGGTIELVRGAQGGLHVDLAVRVRGFEPESLTLVYGASTAERTFGEVTYNVNRGRKFFPAGNAWERSGDRLVLNVVEEELIVGQEVGFTIQMIVDGQEVQDGRTMRVVDEEQ